MWQLLDVWRDATTTLTGIPITLWNTTAQDPEKWVNLYAIGSLPAFEAKDRLEIIGNSQVSYPDPSSGWQDAWGGLAYMKKFNLRLPASPNASSDSQTLVHVGCTPRGQNITRASHYDPFVLVENVVVPLAGYPAGCTLLFRARLRNGNGRGMAPLFVNNGDLTLKHWRRS